MILEFQEIDRMPQEFDCFVQVSGNRGLEAGEPESGKPSLQVGKLLKIGVGLNDNVMQLQGMVSITLY